MTVLLYLQMFYKRPNVLSFIAKGRTESDFRQLNKGFCRKQKGFCQARSFGEKSFSIFNYVETLLKCSWGLVLLGGEMTCADLSSWRPSIVIK